MMLAATVCTPQTPRNQPTNPLLPAEKGVLLLQPANARTMSGRECQAALAAPCWGWRRAGSVVLRVKLLDGGRSQHGAEGIEYGSAL